MIILCIILLIGSLFYLMESLDSGSSLSSKMPLSLIFISLLGIGYDMVSPTTMSYEVIKTSDPRQYVESVVNDGRIKTIIKISQEPNWMFAVKGNTTTYFVYMK